jgi:hypothetical protein
MDWAGFRRQPPPPPGALPAPGHKFPGTGTALGRHFGATGTKKVSAVPKEMHPHPHRHSDARGAVRCQPFFATHGGAFGFGGLIIPSFHSPPMICSAIPPRHPCVCVFRPPQPPLGTTQGQGATVVPRSTPGVASFVNKSVESSTY